MEVQPSLLFEQLDRLVKYDTQQHIEKHGFSIQSMEVVARNDCREVGKTYPAHIVACYALRDKLGKRFIGIRNAESGRNQDIDEFLRRNAECNSLNDKPRLLNSLVDISYYGEIMSEIALAIGKLDDKHPITNKALFDGLTVGPGFNAGLGTSPGSIVTRLFSETITCSSSAVWEVYSNLLTQHPEWRIAENNRDKLFGHTTDTPAEITDVPKSIDERRIIVKQPSGNIALELASCPTLEKGLAEWGINFSTQQDKNKRLAQIGSMGQKSFTTSKGVRSLHFCTIDSKKASDWPSNITRKFLSMTNTYLPFWETVRCDKMMYKEKYVRRGVVKTRNRVVTKYVSSAMGNGITFPFMTMFFTALVKVLYSRADLPLSFLDPMDGEWKPTYGVFGDDIICDKSVVNVLYKFLEYYHFTVNHKKSFTGQEFFRESCGGDFYDGKLVRPVSPVYLETKHDVYSVRNSLNEWAIYHGVKLERSLKYLELVLLFGFNEEPKVVPYVVDPSCGLHQMYARPSRKAKRELLKKTPYRNSRYDSNRAFWAYTPIASKRSVFLDEVHVNPYQKIRWSEDYFILERLGLEELHNWSPYVFCTGVDRFVNHPVFLKTISPNAFLQLALGGYVSGDGEYSVRNDTPEYEITAIWVNNPLSENLHLDFRWCAQRSSASAREKIWQAYTNYIGYFDVAGEDRHI